MTIQPMTSLDSKYDVLFRLDGWEIRRDTRAIEDKQVWAAHIDCKGLGEIQAAERYSWFEHENPARCCFCKEQMVPDEIQALIILCSGAI